MLHKSVRWSKGGGLGKGISKGVPVQKGISQILS